METPSALKQKILDAIEQEVDQNQVRMGTYTKDNDGGSYLKGNFGKGDPPPGYYEKEG